jgi:hypothetical protein
VPQRHDNLGELTKLLVDEGARSQSGAVQVLEIEVSVVGRSDGNPLPKRAGTDLGPHFLAADGSVVALLIGEDRDDAER